MKEAAGDMGDGQEDAALALEEEDGVEKDEREPEVIESARARAGDMMLCS